MNFNKEDDNLYYTYLATPMLDPTGKPNRELFIEDGLHLNENGYSLWQSILKKLFFREVILSFGGIMRGLQIALFFLALLMFVAALFFIGKDTGDTLWRAGIAALLLDVVYIMLWPTSSQRQNTSRES